MTTQKKEEQSSRNLLTLRVITTNEYKYREFKSAFENIIKGVKLEHYPLFYPELQTNSLEVIVKFALQWLLSYFITREQLNGKIGIVIEDAGLFIPALNNFPGHTSKFVYKSIGCEGILKLMANHKNRTAEFISCLGFIDAEVSEEHVFIGKVKGTLALEPRGSGGFGYDPIFIPDGDSRTFAELADISLNAKNEKSHRGKAIKAFIEFLKTKYQLDE